MNTILKIAVFIVAIIIVVVLVNHLKPLPSESPQQSETETAKPVTKVQRPSDQTISKRSKRQISPTGQRFNTSPAQVDISNEESGRRARHTLPEELQKKKEELQQQQEYEIVQAEKIYQMAVFESKVAKKPMMTYKRMVDYCRQIINDYPGTSFAPKARELLREMPERYRQQYNVTDEELGLNIKSMEDR